MTQCRIDQLRIGQRVDLEGDMFADPEYYLAAQDGEESPEFNSEHPEWQFEFEKVLAVEIETDECTRVDFESGFSCGFPPDHEVDVDGEQTFDDDDDASDPQALWERAYARYEENHGTADQGYVEDIIGTREAPDIEACRAWIADAEAGRPFTGC